MRSPRPSPYAAAAAAAASGEDEAGEDEDEDGNDAARRLAWALGLVDQMVLEDGLEPNRYTYNVLLGWLQRRQGPRATSPPRCASTTECPNESSPAANAT